MFDIDSLINQNMSTTIADESIDLGKMVPSYVVAPSKNSYRVRKVKNGSKVRAAS